MWVILSILPIIYLYTVYACMATPGGPGTTIPITKPTTKPMTTTTTMKTTTTTYRPGGNGCPLCLDPPLVSGNTVKIVESLDKDGCKIARCDPTTPFKNYLMPGRVIINYLLCNEEGTWGYKKGPNDFITVEDKKLACL